MEWHTFAEKLPRKGELIWICFSTAISQVKCRTSSNPVYKCIFKNECSGSVILHDLVLISGKATINKKSIWYCSFWLDNVHWARLY